MDIKNCLIEVYGFNSSPDKHKPPFLINNILKKFDHYFESLIIYEYGCSIINHEDWYIQIDKKMEGLDEKLLDSGLQKIDMVHFCSDLMNSDAYHKCFENNEELITFFESLFYKQLMQLETISFEDFDEI